jgi:hypothetical protein
VYGTLGDKVLVISFKTSVDQNSREQHKIDFLYLSSMSIGLYSNILMEMNSELLPRVGC